MCCISILFTLFRALVVSLFLVSGHASAASQVFESGKWHLLSMPGHASAPASTLFGSTLSASTLNKNWTVYTYNTSSGSYQRLGAQDSIDASEAFWFFQRTGQPVTVDWASTLQLPSLRISAACTSSNGCVEHKLNTSDTRSWTLVGSPFTQSVPVNQLRIVTTNGICTQGCTMAMAKQAGLTSGTFFGYDAVGQNYESTSEGGSLQPGSGYWFASSLPASAGSATLLIPSAAGPRISNVAINTITDSSAIVTFTSNENATAFLEFGTTTSYGTTTAPTTLGTTHSIMISGLAQGTTYHYQVNATDTSSNTSASVNATFTTIAATTPGQQLAFPSARGAGAYITGGRGGQVIHVTTLNATGPGSLVEALNTPGPRQIVFDVGGTIDLRSTFGRYQYVVDQSVDAGTYDDVTINGQTAPGGITIESRWFGFNNVDNVIWRYVRFSHEQTPGSADDVVTMNSEDMIFDHCSFTHGSDETVSVYGSSRDLNIGDITFQNNLMFNNKTGMILGGTGDTGGFTVLNNLFVNTSHRFPNLGNRTDAQFDVVNNVVYNFKSRWISMGSNGRPDSKASINFIGNYYKPSNYFRNVFGAGDGYIKDNANQIQEFSLDPEGVEIYTANNVAEGVAGWSVPEPNDQKMWTNFNYSGFSPGDWTYIPLAESPWFVTTQHPLNGEPFAIDTATDTYIKVLADSGANAYLDNNHMKVRYRTKTDQLAIDFVTNDSSTFGGGRADSLAVMGEHTSSVTRPVNFDTDNDGMPDTWEAAVFGDLSKTGADDTDGNGYTNIEEYLNLID